MGLTHSRRATGLPTVMCVVTMLPSYEVVIGNVTGDGISKLVFTILSAVAEAERDRIRERIRDVKARCAKVALRCALLPLPSEGTVSAYRTSA
jgi:hypothetical protein